MGAKSRIEWTDSGRLLDGVEWSQFAEVRRG